MQDVEIFRNNINKNRDKNDISQSYLFDFILMHLNQIQLLINNYDKIIPSYLESTIFSLFPLIKQQKNEYYTDSFKNLCKKVLVWMEKVNTVYTILYIGAEGINKLLELME